MPHAADRRRPRSSWEQVLLAAAIVLGVAWGVPGYPPEALARRNRPPNAIAEYAQTGVTEADDADILDDDIVVPTTEGKAAYAYRIMVRSDTAGQLILRVSDDGGSTYEDWDFEKGADITASAGYFSSFDLHPGDQFNLRLDTDGTAPTVSVRITRIPGWQL